MADNPTLTNKKTSFDADTNADIPVRATDRAGFQTQHLRVDVGDAAESLLKVGQQAMTASVPVVLASDQTVIPVSDNSGSLTVDGTVAVSAVGGTVAISAASLPLPTGAATAALQLPDGHNVTVDNAAGAAAVNIQDGGNSITIDAASLPLPAGAATEATLSTLNGKVTACDTGNVTIAALPNEGQQTMANSISVAIASNQSVIPVSDNSTTLSVDDGAGSLTVDGTVAATQSGPWNITNISGTVSLPNGAATLAEQQTQTTALQLIDNLVLAEDDAHSTGAAGILALTRRADTASTSAGTDGDYATLNTNGDGRLHVADTRTGGSAQNVQGPSAVGASITTGNLFPCGFKDLFNNGVIPTGLDASGVVVLGVLPLDTALNLQDFSPSGEVYVTGLLAHDAADSGGPIKTGGKAASYAPATSNQPSANKTAVASGDRTDGAFNLYGEAVEGVNPFFFTLDNVSTTYNNTTTTATSTAKDCWNYRQASFSYDLTRANSPTDIVFQVEVSLDGTNYAVQQNDFLGDLRESTASIGASGIKKSVTFPIAAQKIRIKATATGTTASATFTVANATLYLRN